MQINFQNELLISNYYYYNYKNNAINVLFFILIYMNIQIEFKSKFHEMKLTSIKQLNNIKVDI